MLNDRDFGPLALASDFGRTKAVRLLLAANAPTEGKDYRGNTPLMHASREVRQSCQALLLRTRVQAL